MSEIGTSSASGGLPLEALRQAQDLVLELSASLAGVVAVVDLLGMGVEAKAEALLTQARDELSEGAVHLHRLREVLNQAHLPITLGGEVAPAPGRRPGVLDA